MKLMLRIAPAARPSGHFFMPALGGSLDETKQKKARPKPERGEAKCAAKRFDITPLTLWDCVGNFYSFYFPDSPVLEIAPALGIIRGMILLERSQPL
jgi:hypothetical protein